MQKLHKYVLLVFLFSGVPAHAFDPGSFVGGVVSIATVWVGYGTYARCTDKTAQEEARIAYKTNYQQAIEKLQQSIEDKKLYNDLCHALDSAESDQQIQNIASFLVHESTTSNGLMNDIRGEVERLRNCIAHAQKHDSARSSKHEIDDSMQYDLHSLIQQAQEKEKKLQSLYEVVKKEHPFIELSHAAYTEHERQNSYERTLKHQARFAHIDAINLMNDDAKRLIHAVEQAKTHCGQHDCGADKKQLITWGKQQLSDLEKQQNALAKTKEFLEEKKSYDAFQLEKEKTAQAQALLQVKCTQERMEHQRHEIKLRDQEIKKEQLRQNDEQLRQTYLILQQGRYFEPEKEQYKKKIKTLKKENSQLESQLESAKKEYQEKLDGIHKESTELDKLLHNPPVNPEAQEGLVAFLTEAIASAQRIHANSFVK